MILFLKSKSCPSLAMNRLQNTCVYFWSHSMNHVTTSCESFWLLSLPLGYYSLSILKRQLERILSLIAAVSNGGCYSKQRATYLMCIFKLSVCVKYCAWDIGHVLECYQTKWNSLSNKWNSLSNIYFLIFWLCGTDWKCIQKIWHLRVFHVPNLVLSIE